MRENTEIMTTGTATITDMEALCRNSIDLIRYSRGLAVQPMSFI